MRPRLVRAREEGRRRYGGHHRHFGFHRHAQGGRAQRRRAAALGAGLARPGRRPAGRTLAVLPAGYATSPGSRCSCARWSAAPSRCWPSGPTPRRWPASGCAHVSLVPTQLRRLLAVDAYRYNIDTLAGFSSVLLGGAAAPASLLEAARGAGVPVVTTYGMTETCGGCVYDGVPLDGVRVAIRDEDDPAPRRGDGTGRIWIGGPVLFSGYRSGGRRRVWGTRSPPGRHQLVPDRRPGPAGRRGPADRRAAAPMT